MKTYCRYCIDWTEHREISSLNRPTVIICNRCDSVTGIKEE